MPQPWLHSPALTKRALAYLGYFAIVSLLVLAAYIVIVLAASTSLGWTLREFDNPTSVGQPASDVAN